MLRWKRDNVHIRTKEDSNNIGIKNIENMMKQMNGLCEVENSGDMFSICLIFRIVD